MIRAESREFPVVVVITWQRCVVVLKTKDGRVVILVQNIDRDGCFGNVRHVGSLNTQCVLLLALVIQRLGQGNLATKTVDAKHSVRIAAIGEIVGQRRVRVHVIGRDCGDNCSHFGSCKLIKKPNG